MVPRRHTTKHSWFMMEVPGGFRLRVLEPSSPSLWTAPFLLLLWLTPCAQLQTDAAGEQSLRDLARRYFNLYAHKDAAGLMELWSAQAPDRDQRRAQFQREFAAFDRP